MVSLSKMARGILTRGLAFTLAGQGREGDAVFPVLAYARSAASSTASLALGLPGTEVEMAAHCLSPGSCEPEPPSSNHTDAFVPHEDRHLQRQRGQRTAAAAARMARAIAAGRGLP